MITSAHQLKRIIKEEVEKVILETQQARVQSKAEDWIDSKIDVIQAWLDKKPGAAAKLMKFVKDPLMVDTLAMEIGSAVTESFIREANAFSDFHKDPYASATATMTSILSGPLATLGLSSVLPPDVWQGLSDISGDNPVLLGTAITAALSYLADVYFHSKQKDPRTGRVTPSDSIASGGHTG